MAEEQARAASPAPERRSGGGGRGFIAGLLGGVLGAGGAIYALQIPAVRENLPLPPQAELIVNPEAVARISALEEELTQLRGGVREAEESASIDSLRARVDQLSQEVTAAATTAQLAELRDGLSALADPAGAAALEERLGELQSALAARIDAVATELAALDEVAARRTTVSALEAAIDGFASRLGALEEGQSEVAATVARLDQLSGELETRTTALDERLSADATALVERAAALTGRIDALARDVTGFREALGAADARVDQLEDATDEELTALRAALDAVAGRTDAVAADAAALREALAATEATVAGFTTAVEARVVSVRETAAAAAERADSALSTAAATSAAVDTALARTRTAAGLNAAASQLDAALATGEPLAAPATTLAGLVTDALDDDERAALEAAREVVAAHGDGVASATRLQRSLADLRPELIAAVTPDEGDGGVADTLLDSFNLRARGVSAEVAGALDDMAGALERGDVAGAVSAAQALPADARAVLAPWLDAARAHVAVAAARDDLLNLGRELAAAAGGS